jgi:hypothetical protein
VSIQTFTGDYNFDITKTTTEPWKLLLTLNWMIFLTCKLMS